MFDTLHRREVVDRTYAPVVVYGTSWCAATQMVRRFLDRFGIPYTYRDIERDSGAASQVRWWSGGYASHPTVQVGGDVLVEPSMPELRRALSQNGLV